MDLAWMDWRRGFLKGPKPEKRRGVSARMIARHEDDARPDVLELLARLSVASSYRVPIEGRSTKPGMRMTDIAAALGMVTSRLKKEAALAVVTRADDAQILKLSRIATPRVARLIRMHRVAPLDLDVPANWFRLRLVVYDAASEFVWPERRAPYAQLARAAKMRKGVYIDVHRAATGVLQQAVNDARRELVVRLWGWG